MPQTQYDEHHGGPWDRGSADSYYGRPRRPHKGGSGGQYGFNPIYDLTPEEVEAYHAGYDVNEQSGNRKEW